MTCRLVPGYEPAHQCVKDSRLHTICGITACTFLALDTCVCTPPRIAPRVRSKPWHNETHICLARLVVAATPFSYALSTVLMLSMIETRNELDMFSEKGAANALPQARLPI
jgi:hypothetical protein